MILLKFSEAGKYYSYFAVNADSKILCYRYSYDITKCMFSAGNVTEKLRIANFDCSREVVVDLYAGIYGCCFCCLSNPVWDNHWT